MRGAFCFFLFLSFGVNAGTISSIEILGNRRTKEHVILRELTFKVGDRLDSLKFPSEKKKSEDNLRNTGLFNFATITFSDSAAITSVKIEVVERWYVWPEFILKFQERNFTQWWVNKNFSRIDYGLNVSHFNFRGRKEKLQIQAKYGFNRKIGLLYDVPYLTKNMKAGLQLAVSYNTQNEAFTGIDSLNKMIYTKNPNEILLETYNIYAEYNYRKNFYTRHYFTAEYTFLSSHHDLLELGNSFLSTNSKFQFLSLRYWFKHDRRDSRNYPLVGFYTDAEIKQFGLGINSDKTAITRIKANYRYYLYLFPRVYFSAGVYAQVFSKKEIPFYFQDGLGFDRYVRSYEPYVLYGQASSFAKVNLKYQLIRPKMYTIPFIKTTRFSKIHVSAFGNIFVDAGYVHNKLSSLRRLDNSLLIGVGTGLDLVTFYDLVWRFEYSINKDGEHGFYLSFVAPI